VFEGGAGKLWDCSQCGGQFVEHALLRELIERREAYGAAVPRRVKRWSPTVEPVHYVPCPLCATLMTRRNFGSSSGVIVDVCTEHGIWFDLGELPRILAFVETGGLAQARRRELANLEAARSRPAPTAPLPAFSGEAATSGSLADQVLRLLGTIGDLIASSQHSDSAH
jgi:Zn-finger nucleic acid-binding protein